VADRLTEEIPGAFQPNQYFNEENPKAHYETTGPEIWEQTDGTIDVLVAGVGTGGTITGTGRYLKERNPELVVVGADPEGSVFSAPKEEPRPYLVEGIGEDFWPTTYDPSLVDRVIPISDEESFLTARRVTHEKGVFIGGSGGTAVAAAVQVARECGPDGLIVVLIPDSGRGYLSRVFDDEWMATYGFLRTGEITVGEVIEARGDAIPPLVYVHPEDKVERAVMLMREYDVSQLPVAKGEMPLATAEIFGAVDELVLMDLAFRDPGVFQTPVEKVMGPRLPTIGIGQPIELAVERLERSPALVVLAGGRPRVVLSRSDVLAFVSSHPHAQP
jgi:cystathionine beta-synthase